MIIENANLILEFTPEQMQYLSEPKCNIGRLRLQALCVLISQIKQETSETIKRGITVEIPAGTVVMSDLELANAIGMGRKFAFNLNKEFQQLGLIESDRNKLVSKHVLKFVKGWRKDNVVALNPSIL